MEEVEQLVDDVLARCPAITRESADRAGIIAGLCEAGASSLPALHSLAESDYAGLKDAIGSAAKLAFTAMLKSAVLKAYRCRPRKRHPRWARTGGFHYIIAAAVKLLPCWHIDPPTVG